MKKILLFIMICFCAVFAMAQKPMKTHFVYEVRNSQGELIKNADVVCTLKVANSTDTVYKETHSVKTDDLGQFSVMLGGGSNIGTSNYSSITWSRTSSYMLYATVNAGNQILGSDVPLTIGGNEDSTTVPNRFATLLPLSRVATTGSYTDLTNRPTSISCFTNDNHFLTSDSTVITTMQDDIDALQTASSNYITTTTLCPTIESNCTNVALQNGSNAFTGNNSFSDNVTFSDTVIVPSGFTFGTTTTETCNNVAVNACDLLAVFDSLQRTIKGLNDKIDGLRDTLNQLRAARTPTFTGVNFTDITPVSATATAVCNDGGATITDYTFSIFQNSDMTSPIGTYPNGDNPVYHFTDLQPAHTYYVNVIATNLKGSTTSYPYPFTTPAYKPTAGEQTVTPTEPAGFTVEVPNVTTGGAENAEARVCYGVMTGEDCSTVTYTCTEWETIAAGTYQKSVTDLASPGATYCVKTEIATNNGDSVLTLGPTTVTVPTVAPTLGTPTVTSQTDNSLTVSVPLTDDGGAPITAATLCAYTDAEFTTPAGGICASSVDFSSSPITGTITGLAPGTDYYVKATATNDDKTGESGMDTPAATDYADPTLSETVTPTPAGNSISVAGELTSLGGATSVDVKVCAYTNDDYSGTPICGTPQNLTDVGDFNVSVDGLAKGTTYYLAVVADNGHKTDTVMTSATTLNLTISSDTTASVTKCGDTLKVTYTATIDNPDNYTYAWKVNGADSTSTTSTLLVNITAAGSYKVTCVATNTTEPTITAADSLTTTVTQGTIPSMGICTDCDAGKAYIKSVSNVSSASWKLGDMEKYTYKTTGTYTIDPGTYIVEVKSASGCTATYENITIDKQYTHCTVNSIHSNESGTGTQLDSVKDHQNNWYEVVQIGTQCWLKENMRATTEPNGTSILQNLASGSSSSVPRAYYYDDSAANYDKYGCLYNWPAAMNGATTEGSRGICPEGWHVPTDDEWTTLTTCAEVGVGSGGTGSGKLAGGCDWYDSSSNTSPNSYAYGDRNSTGFYALPDGICNGINFSGVGYNAHFWSSTPNGSYSVYNRCFYYNSEYVDSDYCSPVNGFSVRCLRDNTGVTLGDVTKTDSTASSLSISAEYTATQDVTSATVCAYTDESCTTPAGECATGVAYNISPITGTITGLTPGTEYYVKVTATTEGGTESKVAGPFGTAAVTMTISSNPSSATVNLCEQASVSVTYTANLEGATASEYGWSTSGGSATASTTSTYTVNYTTAGTYTVTCTAAGATATKQVTIASGGTAATLGLCEDCNAGSITVKSGNCTSLTWVNNADPTKTATTSGTANTVLNESADTPEGVYTVTGTNSDGCSITKTATLGKATAHPCTVTSLRTGTALDGGKYANKEYGTGTRLDSVSDHQGNVYRVVQIGEGANAQCWLAENMRATTEPNGTNILKNPASGNSSTDPRAYYYNNSAANYAKYGCLYNWPAAMNGATNEGVRGICPEGWHVPTDGEWTTLTTSAGVGVGTGDTGAGKLAGGCDWYGTGSTTTPNSYAYGARNSTGFYALPAGSYGGSSFGSVGYTAFFWSSSPDGSGRAYDRNLYYSSSYVSRYSYSRTYGCSVRCLRDEAGITLGEVTKTDSTASSLSISAEYSGSKAVTSATVCAYTDESCTTPAGECATGVAYSISPITGTITGLTPGTEYYVKVTATTEGGTESKVAGPFGTKAGTMTISSNPASATVKLCGQSSVTVTYTANLEGATASEYAWSTSGGSATESTGSAYTVSYTTAGTYTVTCTAAGVSATKEVTIASDGTAATLGLCEDCNAGSITMKSGNCTSLTWVSNEDATKTGTVSTVSANTVVLSESASAPAGIYTFTGTNSDGCTVTRTAVLGEYVAHPCTVTSLREGTDLGGGKWANKEYGTNNQLDSVSDHQGNVYRVVQIGEGANAQCWLAENMRATTEPNGTNILKNPASGNSRTDPCAYYYNDNAANYAKYGCLYNWPAAMNGATNEGVRGICPEGWHVPTDGEWTTLTTSAGVGVGTGGTGAGKLAGDCDWSGSGSTTTPNSYGYGARNSTGFYALPAGYRTGYNFNNVGDSANFWSSTPDGSRTAYYRHLNSNTSCVDRDYSTRDAGYSVRCLRD